VSFLCDLDPGLPLLSKAMVVLRHRFRRFPHWWGGVWFVRAGRPSYRLLFSEQRTVGDLSADDVTAAQVGMS
jgi:hypothetical protein